MKYGIVDMHKLPLSGFIQDSFQEYENECALVLFTTGCNLACTYCHNKKYLWERKYDAFDIINTRLRPNHTAVVVLGGEPTFHDNLPSLLQHIKTTGRKTKVFTNGLGAKSIDDCVPYLDSCSVDFKTSLNPAVLGVDISIKAYMRRVKDTLNVLKHSLIPTEVRTTTAPGITDIDVEQITTLLALTYPDMEHIIQE